MFARGDAVLGDQHLETVTLEQQPHPSRASTVRRRRSGCAACRPAHRSRLRPASGVFMMPAAPHATSARSGKLTRNVVPPPARLHVDAAAVVGDDAVDDGQAEPGALAEGAAERLEDRVDVLGRDADAFVFDAQDGRASAAARPRAARSERSAPPLASPAGRWSRGSRRSAGPAPRRLRPSPRHRTACTSIRWRSPTSVLLRSSVAVSCDQRRADRARCSEKRCGRA